MSSEHLAACSRLTMDETLLNLVWNHENSYLYEECMDEQNARDTQFQGYAKALVEEIINEVPATIYPLDIDISDKLEKLIARRAYDFMYFHVEQTYKGNLFHGEIRESMKFFSDMTELPKEANQCDSTCEMAAMAWGMANGNNALILDLQRQVNLLHEEVFCTHANRPATRNQTLLGDVRELRRMVFSLQKEESKSDE